MSGVVEDVADGFKCLLICAMLRLKLSRKMMRACKPHEVNLFWGAVDATSREASALRAVWFWICSKLQQ